MAKWYDSNVFDGLKNLMSKMGIEGRDKNVSNSFYCPTLSADELTNAYRADWIAGKAIDIPAEDATREWRAWQAEADQITAIEEVEKKFRVSNCVEEGIQKSRLYGGAGIVIGIRGAKWNEPLDPTTVKQGDLQFLHVVDSTELKAGEMNWDLLSHYYGLPKYYSGSSTSQDALNIHPSRIVRFVGRPYPQRSLNADGWGDSVLLRLYQALMQAALASEGVAQLIQEAAVDVIKMPDLMNNASSEEYQSRFVSRWQIAMANKSITRMLVIDKDEDYEKKQINFSNLPEVVRLYLTIAAGACDIPVTRLLGTAPQGLNATGESDIRNYYDSVADKQKNKIGPAMNILDQCIVASALGKVDDQITYDWRPLWQPTESEQADNFLKVSQGVANIYTTGLVPDEALAKGLQNRLIEDGTLPGLEQAIEEAELLGLDEDDDDVKEQFAKGKETEEETEEESADDE